MRIIVSSGIILHDVPDSLHSRLLADLVFSNPKYESAVKYGYYARNIPKSITLIQVDRYNNKVVVPRGYWPWLQAHLNELGIKPSVTIDTVTYPLANPIKDTIELRPYQEEAVAALLSNPYGVLKAPAGSGKTVMGLKAIIRLGQRALWLTHTGPLFKQIQERLSIFAPDVKPGIISSGTWKVGDEITIGMVQTFARNIDRLANELSEEFGTIVLDEAHHAPATTFTSVIQQFKANNIYGLTATDKRRDNLEAIMYSVIGPITYEVRREHILEKLVTPTVIGKMISGSSPIPQDLPYTKMLQILTYDAARNDIIVNDILDAAYMGYICIAVTERVAHAELLYERIKERWDLTGLATGKLTKKQVAEQVRLLESKEVTVLIATSSLIGEGFDHGPLERLFICQPFRNEARCEQIVGRVQRRAEGKTDAHLIDYIDDHSLLRHQYYNSTDKACRRNVYAKLGCTIIDSVL